MISTRKDLNFYIKADYMMNRGRFTPSFKDRILNILSPDYIINYLRELRMVEYYSNVGG